MSLTEAVRPTLLVGVGGTGVGIAERVFAQVQAAGQADTARIGVLGFDTDTNDLKRLRRVEKRNQIQLSGTDTVFSLLEKNPGVAPWFGPRDALPHDVMNMTLLDGAGQIRLLTRLGLHHAMRTGGVERLVGDAIAKLGVLNAKDVFEGQVNVMMVGSLAGATGSGSFISLALLIDHVCRSRNISVDIRALFLLPDVFVRGGSLPRDQVPNILANGYAALKELNAVNVVVKQPGAKAFPFEYVPGRFLREGGAPFKNVALIDYENVRGGSLGRSLDAYKEMAARATYLLIFTPIGQKTASVSINDVRARMAAAGENLYAGTGVSAVKYPADEMARYLTVRLARENLDGDWLRLDRAFFDRARRYEELRREVGSASAQRPLQGESFLEDLRNLATKDRLPFFVEIHDRLHPTVRDERTGREAVLSRHVTFLDALVREATSRFWGRERLGVIGARTSLDSSHLANKAALVDLVRRLENQLDDDMKQVGDAIKLVPESDFRNILATADDLAEGEWRDYHIQSYVIRNGPHLVEVRAFLYELRREIAKRRAALNPDEPYSRLIRAANAFDENRPKDPTERRLPRIIELARETANRNFVQRLVKGSAEQFQGDYANYYNGSMNALKTWANDSVNLKVLEQLDDEAEHLERYLAGLFVELAAVFDSLSHEASVQESLHGAERATVDGNVWVYADAAAKKQGWDTLRLQSLGLRLDAGANKALATKLHRRYRDDRKQRSTTDFRSLGELFRLAVVDEFAREVVEKEFRSLHDFSVIEAVRREASLLDVDFAAYLRRVVDIASSQAEPFLTLRDQDDGQRVIFWAVHPGAKAEINNDQVFSELFTAQQGESPLEEAEFNDKELLCMNNRVNLELTDLAKLQPGDKLRTNVNVRDVGAYARAYNGMVEGLIDAEIAGAGMARQITPHLDASWHRPGSLPEIFPDITRGIGDDLARASVVALGMGLLDFTTEYGAPVVEFSTVGYPAAGNIFRRVAETHDLWVVLHVFEARADLVRSSLRYWDGVERALSSGGRGAPDPMERLRAPELLTRILELGIVRDDAAAREERVRMLVSAWMALLRRSIGLVHRDLAEPGREAMVGEIVRPVWREAVAALRERGVREETVRAIDRVLRQAAGESGLAAVA